MEEQSRMISSDMSDEELNNLLNFKNMSRSKEDNKDKMNIAMQGHKDSFDFLKKYKEITDKGKMFTFEYWTNKYNFDNVPFYDATRTLNLIQDAEDVKKSYGSKFEATEEMGRKLYEEYRENVKKKAILNNDAVGYTIIAKEGTQIPLAFAVEVKKTVEITTPVMNKVETKHYNFLMDVYTKCSNKDTNCFNLVPITKKHGLSNCCATILYKKKYISGAGNGSGFKAWAASKPDLALTQQFMKDCTEYRKAMQPKNKKTAEDYINEFAKAGVTATQVIPVEKAPVRNKVKKEVTVSGSVINTSWDTDNVIVIVFGIVIAVFIVCTALVNMYHGQ